MKLYFENSQGVERLISEPQTLEEAFAAIKNFLDTKNYKMYYCREIFNEAEKTITYDVGSHTEFFHLKDVPSHLLKKSE